MVYKLISEWKSKDGNTHEIMIFKYNYNHEEAVKYVKTGFELLIQTSVCAEYQYKETYDLRSGNKKWWNYNSMEVKK